MKITSLKRRFTKWYVKRGYTYCYKVNGNCIRCDDIFIYPTRVYDSVFDCPWWVKPLLIFFSPSIYFMEAYGRIVVDSFEQGMNKARGLRSNIQIIDEIAGIWHPCKYDTYKLIHDGTWEDGKWYKWFDKYGNTEIARMKKDAFDHFYPQTKLIKEKDVIAFMEIKESED